MIRHMSKQHLHYNAFLVYKRQESATNKIITCENKVNSKASSIGIVETTNAIVEILR